MSNELQTQQHGQVLEQLLIKGDLAALSPEDRVKYYMNVCESLGLNPSTRPFDLMSFNGKMVLYTNRSGADQLRSVKKISIVISNRHRDGDIYTVTARAQTPSGQTDESTGSVCLTGLKGDALANAYMKAETKAKRRVTLSIAGLGWMDESEAETIPGAKKETIDIPKDIESKKPAIKEESLGSNQTIGPTAKFISPTIQEEERKKLGKTIDQLRNELGMTKEELNQKAKNKMIENFFTCTIDQLKNLIFELELQLEKDRPEPGSGE